MNTRTGSVGGVLDRGVPADLWRNTLTQIPSMFGRLVYLCSLRDANTGVYEHYGLAQIFGSQAADEALRNSHQQVFLEWLGYGLEEQKADLDLYLTCLDGNRRVVLDTWIRLAPYRNLVPSTVRDAERSLYVRDLETILELLRAEYGVASPDPDA